MTNEQIVKALAEKLEVKITIADAQEGKCCVEEPPEPLNDVLLIQDGNLSAEDNFFGWYSEHFDTWRIYGIDRRGRSLAIPRSAMAGIRWVEVE